MAHPVGASRQPSPPPGTCTPALTQPWPLFSETVSPWLHAFPSPGRGYGSLGPREGLSWGMLAPTTAPLPGWVPLAGSGAGGSQSSCTGLLACCQWCRLGDSDWWGTLPGAFPLNRVLLRQPVMCARLGKIPRMKEEGEIQWQERSGHDGRASEAPLGYSPATSPGPCPPVPLGCTSASPPLRHWMRGKAWEAWGQQHAPVFKACKQVYF